MNKKSKTKQEDDWIKMTEKLLESFNATFYRPKLRKNSHPPEWQLAIKCGCYVPGCRKTWGYKILLILREKNDGKASILEDKNLLTYLDSQRSYPYEIFMPVTSEKLAAMFVDHTERTHGERTALHDRQAVSSDL